MSHDPLTRKVESDIPQHLLDKMDEAGKYILNTLSILLQKDDAKNQALVDIKEQTTKTNGRVTQQGIDAGLFDRRLKVLEHDKAETKRYRRRLIGYVIFVAPMVYEFINKVLFRWLGWEK